MLLFSSLEMNTGQSHSDAAAIDFTLSGKVNSPLTCFSSKILTWNCLFFCKTSDACRLRFHGRDQETETKWPFVFESVGSGSYLTCVCSPFTVPAAYHRVLCHTWARGFQIWAIPHCGNQLLTVSLPKVIYETVENNSKTTNRRSVECGWHI